MGVSGMLQNIIMALLVYRLFVAATLSLSLNTPVQYRLFVLALGSREISVASALLLDIPHIFSFLNITE